MQAKTQKPQPQYCFADTALRLDRQGTVLSVTSASGSSHGEFDESVLGAGVGDLLPPYVAKQIAHHTALALDSGQIESFEYRREMDGEIRDYVLQIVPIAPQEILLTVQNATEQKQTAQALQENEAYLASLLESMRVGVVIIDPVTHQIVDLNPYAVEMMGCVKTEAIGNVCHGYLCPASVGKCPITDLGRTVDLSEKILINNSGEHVPILKSVVPVVRAGREYLLETFTDISRQKQSEKALRVHAAQLERTNRELQDMTYVASHDLQEPLRKIQAFADRLNREYEDALGTKGQLYLSRIQKGAERVRQLIQDLLDYSRVTTKVKPFTEVDLGWAARKAISRLNPLVRAAQADIHVADLPTVEADSRQMCQLFEHLIDNAIKFRSDTGAPVVNIRSSSNAPSGQAEDAAHQSHCKISVSDNGIGFDEKYADRIFTLFQRLHPPESYEGTGTGLAICRKIVERHHGTIAASSQPGVGTTMTVTLPIQQ